MKDNMERGVADFEADKYADNRYHKASLLRNIDVLEKDFFQNAQVQEYLGGGKEKIAGELKGVLESINSKLQTVRGYIEEFPVESDSEILGLNVFLSELGSFAFLAKAFMRKAEGQKSLVDSNDFLARARSFDGYLADRADSKEAFMHDLMNRPVEKNG